MRIEGPADGLVQRGKWLGKNLVTLTVPYVYVYQQVKLLYQQVCAVAAVAIYIRAAFPPLLLNINSTPPPPQPSENHSQPFFHCQRFFLSSQGLTHGGSDTKGELSNFTFKNTNSTPSCVLNTVLFCVGTKLFNQLLEPLTSPLVSGDPVRQRMRRGMPLDDIL